MGVLTRSDGWWVPTVESSSDEPSGLYYCQELRKENGVKRCNLSCGATSKMEARSNRSFVVPNANFLN